MQQYHCLVVNWNLRPQRPISSFLIQCILVLTSTFVTGIVWAVDSAQLSVGIFPRRDAEVTRTMFQPLMDHLQEELELNVTLDVPPDFEAFWERLNANRYDLVHLNQYQYLRAHHHFGYSAILKNEELGRSDIASVIWVRKASGINQPADLKGRKITFGGGVQAMVSCIMAVDLLREHGLTENDYLAQYALNPVSAVLSVYYRQSMAAGAGDVLPQVLGLKTPIKPSEIKPLLTSQPVAQLPWAISPALSEEMSLSIMQLLTGLKDTVTGKKLLSSAGLTGLVAATDKDYDPHRQIIARVLQEYY